MSDKEFKISLIVVVISFVVLMILAYDCKKQKIEDDTYHMTVQEEIAQNTLNDRITHLQPTLQIEVNHYSTVSDNDVEVELEYDELEYLAACVEAEAGTQGLMGKRIVVDVILNRVDDSRFPNGIIGVINAPGQFAVVHNGAINKVSITQETFDAIKMELEHRTDTEVLYFRNNHYGTGKPLYQINDHYFSK